MNDTERGRWLSAAAGDQGLDAVARDLGADAIGDWCRPWGL
jgi:hypothetical protein